MTETPVKKSSPVKNVLNYLARFALSGALLWWLFSKIDTGNMIALFQTADWSYLALAFGVYVLVNFVILGRWYALILALDLKVPLFTVIRYFFIGLFCNLFLPSAIGGDVIKCLGLCRHTEAKPKVFATVLLDRLSGFFGMVLLSSVAFFIGYQYIQDMSVLISIGAVAAISVVIGAVLFNNTVYAFCCRIFKPFPKIEDGLMRRHYDIVLLKDKKAYGVLAVALSIASQLVLAAIFFLIALAMGQDISFIYFVIFSPLVCIVSSLPSIGGLGVREVGWAVLLAKVGVAGGVAAGISLMGFAFMVIVGLVGGLFYVTTLSAGRIQLDPQAAGACPKEA